MKSCKKLVFAVLAALLVAGAASADLIWDAGGDGKSIFQEANWVDTDTGADPAAGAMDPKVEINNAVIVNEGTPGGPGGGSPHLRLGMAGSLTINGGVFRMVSGGGIQADDVVGGDRCIISMTGGELLATFMSDMDVTLAGDAGLTLYGGGNPVNNSVVNIIGDASVHFLAEDVTEFANEHLGKFTVEGTDAVIGANLSVVSDGADGSIVSVIPEPATLALLGLGGLLIGCRRK